MGCLDRRWCRTRRWGLVNRLFIRLTKEFGSGHLDRLAIERALVGHGLLRSALDHLGLGIDQLQGYSELAA